MKRIIARLVATAAAALMLLSSAGCGMFSNQPVKYDIGHGMSAMLPGNLQEIQLNGFEKVLANRETAIYFVRETDEELALAGYEDITVEEYAELSEAAYNLEPGYAADANGNLVATYTADVNGEEWLYYATLRKGEDCFWTVNFTCSEADKDEYMDLFSQWNASIVAE